jgi:hypothetical protein
MNIEIDFEGTLYIKIPPNENALQHFIVFSALQYIQQVVKKPEAEAVVLEVLKEVKRNENHTNN